MGIASLKPYNMIGVQNKLYRMYGRKLSLRGQFSFATRFLKEKGKESIYEKPYLDLSRPQMHQDPPTPDWPSDPPPVGQYPPGDPRYLLYIFAPGIVSLFVFGPVECGETTSGSAHVSLQSAHNKTAQNIWKITSNDDRARVTNIETWPPIIQHSANFNVEVDEVDDKVDVQIRARVMLFGDLVRKLLVPMFVTEWGATYPMPGWEGTPHEPPTASVFPLEIWKNYVYPEEIHTLTLEACACSSEMAWDNDASAETIARSASVNVQITDAESGSPYSWSVAGIGFTLDNPTTIGLSNTLIADGTACGAAVITVTGCDGNDSVVGEVRCTEGSWSGYTAGCKLTGSADQSYDFGRLLLTKTVGKYQQLQSVHIREYSIDSCDDENCAENCGYGYCHDTYGCTNCLTWECNDFGGNYQSCQEWCCASVSGVTCATGTRCMCNKILSWREWEC